MGESISPPASATPSCGRLRRPTVRCAPSLHDARSCRLSEALALTADRVDLAAGVLVIESLKKRRVGIYRAVPVPPALLDALDLAHGLRERRSRRG